MANIAVTWRDTKGIDQFEDAMRALSSGKIAKAEARALNRAGSSARAKVRKALTKQTGLKRSTIVRAVKSERASSGKLAYRMQTAGGNVRLKFFNPREFRKGVKASPFGKRQLFPGTFLKGGAFPNRKALSLYSGNVLKRKGRLKHPVQIQRSGVYIPSEMVKGNTAEAFNRTVAEVLPKRIEHELARATGGVMS